MATVEDKITAHMTALDEQRIGIERVAEMIAAYHQALVSGGVGEQLASLLTLQYQMIILSQGLSRATQGGQG